MIGRTISHYEIIEQIDDGGMGTVYKALDTKLQVHRALKFIHPHLVTDAGFKHRFIQEAQAASSLDHPNICGVHEVDETPNGRPFICMTYYDGVTLSERLEGGALPALEVFRIGFSIASGLGCAHQNGIIHRDIKPSNIMITADGYTKILDFGLAKLMGIAGVTKTGVTMGTVRYMSPEQATGEKTDHRSDIWALGLLMYEMATGEYPFTGDFDPAIIYSIINTRITPAHELNPDIPKALSAAIARCLEKDPARRYQSLADLLKDLGSSAQEAGWGSSLGEIALPISSSGFGTITARRRIWQRGLLATAAIVVAAAVLVWWFGRPPPLYTTDLRVAVMSLENRSHPDKDHVTAGMWEVVFHLLDDGARRQDSMWVVPNRLVRYSKIKKDDQALRTFGVNRIITGGLHRFEGGEVLNLVLRDAKSLESLASVRVPFDPATTAFADSLPGALADLLDLSGGKMGDTSYLPEDGPAATMYLQGVGTLQAGDHVTALASFQAATTDAPVFAMGWTGLGMAQWLAHVSTGDEDFESRSVASLERGVTLAAGAWRPQFELGEVQRLAGRYEESLTALYAAVALSPDNPRVTSILGRVLRYEDRWVKAEEVLQSAVGAHPDFLDVHRQLANFHYFTGDFEAAETGFLRVLSLAPDEAFSMNTLGAIYQRRGEYTRARFMFERAYSLLPNHLTCSNIGLMLFHEGKFRESASYYELSTQWPDEVDAITWANWGKALYNAEGGREESVPKLENAIELFEEDRRKSPDDLYILGNLLDIHAMLGDTETAHELIALAESMGPDNGLLFYQIGTAHELLGDRVGALRYLGEALRFGVPVQEIRATPELKDLVVDPRFTRMIAAASGQIASQADSLQ